MPNSNKPFGLRPVKSRSGADWDGRGNVYSIPTSDTTNSYYIGDLVRLAGSADANGIASVVKYAAGDSATPGLEPVGVILGIGINPNGPYINPADLTLMNAPATKAQAYYALVCDDPDVIFEVQEANSGTALAAAAVGLNADLTITANQTTGRVSSTVLNNGTEAATITLTVKLLGLTQVPGNAFGLAARWLVSLNAHAYGRPGTTGV